MTPKDPFPNNINDDFEPYEGLPDDGDDAFLMGEVTREELVDMAKKVLPLKVEVMKVLELSSNIDIEGLASGAILTDELSGRINGDDLDRILAASLLIDSDNFSEIESSFHPATLALVYEFAALENKRAEHERIDAVRAFSDGAKKIFLSGLIADLEASSETLAPDEEIDLSPAEYDRIGKFIIHTTHDCGMDAQMLRRTVDAYNKVGKLAGHDDGLAMDTAGNVVKDPRQPHIAAAHKPKPPSNFDL